ncbi:MAG: PhnD/SsuA/transferrin family substrate-binding protein [Anaerolineae bacterium]|nr:PhnD/SsuA/transferrin family substrate-binding protein [Anaerolineae bacterium]
MSKRWQIILATLLVILAVSACGPSGPRSTPRPTQTPFSTPLPWISTPVPAGSAGNPVRMALIPAEELSSEQVSEFESLFASSGVAVQLIISETEAEVMGLLCANTTAENAVVAWLDGMGYISAYGRLCGQAQLVLISSDDDMELGERVDLLIRPELGTQQVNAAEGRTFCRIGYQDVYSWLIPQLWFAQVDFDIAKIGTIEDLEDYQAIADGVIADECDLGAVPGSVIDSLEEEDGFVVAKTSPILPYSVLVVPPGLPQDHAEAISQVLLDAAQSSENDALFSDIFGDYGIQTVDSDLISDLHDFVDDSEFEFVQVDR